MFGPTPAAKVYSARFTRACWTGEGGGDVTAIRLYVERENEKGQATYRALGMQKTSYEVFEQGDLTESIEKLS